MGGPDFPEGAEIVFSGRVEIALRVAFEAHAGQTRRNCGSPYVTHPIQVALMLSRLGATATVVQAGLLHDVVEDCETWTMVRLEGEFGIAVASIVAEVTEDKTLGWTDRKEHAIRSVPGLSDGALLLKACDKLHNLESIARALRESDDASAVWAAFKGGRDRSLDKSGRLVEALCLRLDGGYPGVAASLVRVMRAIRSD